MATDNLARQQIYMPATTPEDEIVLRVAAYCRVSSDSEDQLNSFTAQNTYYHRMITAHERWELVDIYADEGITGTSARKRDDFQRMLKDCRKGKIDKILAKSISRFARNTSECLETIRELKALGISIFFEEHNIDTKMVSSEMLTAVLASCAQAESESISKNVAWGNRKRMEKGVFTPSSAPYGYRLVNSRLVVDEGEAATVRLIFAEYLSGVNPGQIARQLTEIDMTGKLWSRHTVEYIIKKPCYNGCQVFAPSIQTDDSSAEEQGQTQEGSGTMAHYVVADIHGEADRFHAMLEKIRFSDEDMLYILGDVIDRGLDGIRLLQEIMHTPNMIMLLGNHEYMMLQYLAPGATGVDIRRWNKNGNAPTLAAYLQLSAEEQQEILYFLRTRLTHLEVTVNGQTFYLVHAWPADNVHDEVWLRPEIDAPNPKPGCRVIIGHTKVLSLIQPEEARIAHAIDLEDRGEHLQILHTPGFIDIDCGCGYDMPIKALACVRLEDLEEYYI